ncbi:TrkA C-terminal domain-containing protein [Phytomonospora sp. NPDC050363]|uniref:cation:proton antiporter regulatory subunit n=1 Tax=Phytomonospora sp. NPDC050363 TaxID=3155642 RepID=UPI0033CE2784
MSSTPLPGIGVRYDLDSEERRHVSVVAHRDGSRTVAVHHSHDPDDCAQAVHLTSGESQLLINALAPDHHSPSLLHTTALGLVAERIELPSTSHWNGRLMGEACLRTETGASIVAVLRTTEALPSPTPSFRLAGGDILIVIGTREGVDAAAAILLRD